MEWMVNCTDLSLLSENDDVDDDDDDVVRFVISFRPISIRYTRFVLPDSSHSIRLTWVLMS